MSDTKHLDQKVHMTFSMNIQIKVEMLQEINRQLKEQKLQNRKIHKIVKQTTSPNSFFLSKSISHHFWSVKMFTST